MVEQFPMVSQLVKQFGLGLSAVVEPEPTLLIASEQVSFNVFYIPEALGSPYIPAQEEFVIRHGIKSVLGVGGLLPSEELFAVIIFSNVSIPETTAEMFKTLALNIKMAVLPFSEEDVFVE